MPLLTAAKEFHLNLNDLLDLFFKSVRLLVLQPSDAEFDRAETEDYVFSEEMGIWTHFLALCAVIFMFRVGLNLEEPMAAVIRRVVIYSIKLSSG